jgi:hypothetical protein
MLLTPSKHPATIYNGALPAIAINAITGVISPFPGTTDNFDIEPA